MSETTKATETDFSTKPAVKAGKPETKQVSALIPLDLYSALDEHRWTIRAERFSDVVKVALEEYAVNHKLVK